ncbi:serine/threonine protein kinase, partial [Streptomonospora nanhaiensis]
MTDFVRNGGPLRGQALHRLAVSCVAAMAKLHARGIAGLRLSPDSVALGTRGQVLIGWQTSQSRY